MSVPPLGLSCAQAIKSAAGPNDPSWGQTEVILIHFITDLERIRQRVELTDFSNNEVKELQRQIEENLEFTDTVGALSLNQGRYTDHRFGFTITHLPEGGSLILHPMLAAGESSTMMSYHTPDGALFSGFAVSSSRPLEDQRLLSNISAALGLTASPTKLAPPKEVWLHGVPARKWTWVSPEGEVQIYLLNIPPLIYGFLTLSSQASNSASNTKKPRFELVKP